MLVAFILSGKYGIIMYQEYGQISNLYQTSFNNISTLRLTIFYKMKINYYCFMEYTTDRLFLQDDDVKEGD